MEACTIKLGYHKTNATRIPKVTLHQKDLELCKNGYCEHLTQKRTRTLMGGWTETNNVCELCELKIKKLIESLEFKPNEVTLIGRVSHQEVLIQMTQCDFYISNSKFETFGMTICEALLSGKPVISTLSGGPNEFLNQSNSITIDKCDNLQLKDAIIDMALRYPTFNSDNISKQIRESYGSETVRKKTLKFYSI